jgi:hypothetical protein
VPSQDALKGAQEGAGLGSFSPDTVVQIPGVDPAAAAVIADRLSRARSQQRIGANLSYVRHYTATQEFNDLVMGAESFGDVAVPGSSNATLNAEGWPVGDFSIMLLHDQKGTKGLGTPALGDPKAKYYTIVFSGEADVSVLNSLARLGVPDTKTAPGKTIIQMSFPEGGNSLSLGFVLRKDKAGKPLQPVTDLQVLRPGVDWQKPPMFTDAFLKHLEPFSTIRFMDWLDTNAEVGKSYTGPVGVWDQRPTAKTKRTSSGDNVPRGQPWERIVELSNTRGVDIWINIPPLAGKDYATKLAKFLKDPTTGLKYGQRVYVEYGNEMWNTQFQGTLETWASGLSEVVAGTELGKKLDYDLKTKGNGRSYTDFQVLYGERLYVERLIQVSEAFREVFGDQEMMSRIRPVLTWQIVNPGTMTEVLDYVLTNYKDKPPAHYFYAMSGAPYYGMAAADLVNTNSLFSNGVKQGKTMAELQAAPYAVSPSDILASMANGIKENPIQQWYEVNVAMARKHKLKWIAYEGGPDTFGPASYLNKAIASRDAKMLGLCQAHLDSWAKAGGDLFMWFVAGAGTWDTVYGTYPLVENLSEGGPKYDCMTWASKTDAPMPVSRHPLPASDAAKSGDALVMSAGEVTAVSGDKSLQFNDFPAAKLWGAKDQSRDYVVSAANAGCFNLTFKLKNTAYTKSMTSVPFKLVVNGDAPTSTPVSLAASSVIPPASALVEVPYAYGQVCVPQGISALTLVATENTSLTLESLVFTKP